MIATHPPKAQPHAALKALLTDKLARLGFEHTRVAVWHTDDVVSRKHLEQVLRRESWHATIRWRGDRGRYFEAECEPRGRTSAAVMELFAETYTLVVRGSGSWSYWGRAIGYGYGFAPELTAAQRKQTGREE